MGSELDPTFNCKKCKATIDVEEGQATTVCPFCGTENRVPARYLHHVAGMQPVQMETAGRTQMAIVVAGAMLALAIAGAVVFFMMAGG